MPFSASYTLPPFPTLPTLVQPPPVIPSYPTNGGGSDCKPIFYNQTHFLDMFDRLYPLEYMSPLKTTPNGGYEHYEAAALVGERVSLAVSRLECGSFIIFAEGGQRATGEVVLSRSLSSATQTVTVKAGSIVSTGDGRDFFTTLDQTFSATASGPVSVPVQAVAMGYEWNVPGEVITPSGIVLPGEIDTATALVLVPAYGDTTFAVSQVLPTSGGRAPMLDGLGEDRGLPRQQAEPDPHYRLRIRTLPDTVSPDAIFRTVDSYLTPLGVGFDLIETWELTYQTFYDAPMMTFASNPDYDGNLCTYDDPRDNPPFRNRWLGRDMLASFILVIDNVTLQDTGGAYDDPGVTSNDFTTPGLPQPAFRGMLAFDVPDDADPSIYFPAAYDGYDIKRAAVVYGLIQLLKQVKAFAVLAAIELAGQ